jgi:nucleotide-binding universal stress UspA family protein
MIQAIAHPTDFSAEGRVAFAHALRLALHHRCRLDLLHVRSPSDRDMWDAFPHVRETLAQWGLLEAGAPVETITSQLGITVRKIEIRHADAVSGVVTYLAEHRPELVVAATHGRAGLSRWLSGSVSEGIARQSHLPTLFVGPTARPFVDSASGDLSLKRILIPVAHAPSPHRALPRLAHLFEPLMPRLYPLHVGEVAPAVFGADGDPIAVTVTQGSLVETILELAESVSASLIAMPTAGHQGFLDALRGSTTEQVLHRASCPVLALPA